AALAAAEGPDRLLAEPRLLELLRTSPGLAAPSAALLLYVSVRHTLRESGIDDARLSDYLGALLLEFGLRDRAYRISEHDDEVRYYLVDLLADLQVARGRRAFLLCAHMGNYSLWLAGIFPDLVGMRELRKGAPGFRYYDEMGARGYRLAAHHGLARELDLDDVDALVAERLARVRIAVNRLSDRVLLPAVSRPG